MSSSETIISLQQATQQIYLYLGLFVFITGVIGESLNILIFTTLKTFRKTPCGFYLTAVSVSNFGQTIVAVLIRTLSHGFDINMTQSPWICKIREFLVPFFALMSFTGICLAAIDQFLSLIRPQWNNLHLAHRHIAFFCLFWFGHNIPYLIYSDVQSGYCTHLNISFVTYVNYFIWPVLLGCLPIFIMIVFSVSAFCYVRMMNRNQINVIHSSHCRQLTKMTLIYVMFIVILSVPCIIFTIYTLNPGNIITEQSTRNTLIYTILSMFYYESYACSFYIYSCASKRFRKQVVYVLIDVHLKRWQNKVNQPRSNQVGLFVSNVESRQAGNVIAALY